MAEVTISKEEAEFIIKTVLFSLEEKHRANLVLNIKSGRKLHCNEVAYKFSDVNAGDITVLATSVTFPTHPADYQVKSEVDKQAIELYNQIVRQHTMKYYMATCVLDEEHLKRVILSCLDTPHE